MRETDEIRALNTLRGLAALVVVAYHAPGMFGARHWVPHGYLAVDLFFVISGFVITHAYQHRIDRGLGFGLFLRRRMARLYPLYLAATVAGAALYLWRVSDGLSPPRGELLTAFGLNLLLLPADTAGVLDNRAAYPFALQSWSIIWEIALSAVFFGWAKRSGRKAAVIAGAAALLLAAAAMARGTLDGGFTLASFWVGGLRAAFGFFAGAAVFAALVQLRPWMWRALAVIGVPAGILTGWYIVMVRPTYWAADLLIALALFPLLVAVLARWRPKLAEHGLGDLLGQASYSIYLLHGLAIGLGTLWLIEHPEMTKPWRFAFGCAWLGALLVLSWLCWRWFESPMRRALAGPAGQTERMAFNATA